MKQLSSRVFTKLSVEWKTDGASSQEVRILHRGAGEGRSEEEIAGRRYDCAQPLIPPFPLPKGRGNIASCKWSGRCGFIGNGLRFAILLVGLCAPTFSRAALVAAWGYDTSGQTRLPVGVNNVKAIAAGEHHSLALMNDGSVAAWGSNGQGQSTVPSGLTSVKAIAAGSFFSFALKADGTVVAWGYNYDGQTNVPDNLSRITAIACGSVHTLALNASGTVTAWGQNMQGQTNVPAGLSDVISIAAGGAHSLALKADGSVVAWGYNFYSQSNVPDSLSNVTAVAAGGAFSLALKADGNVVAWGNNSYGQTTIPAGLSNVTAIAASQDYVMALKMDGVVVAWGRNPYGEYPVPPGLSNVTAIATGGYHSLALVPEGPVQILQNPQSQGIPYTSNATFSVVATGREPLSYHWLFNGSPISPNPHVSGTTNATLSLSSAQFSDVGTYTVIVSNALGSVISPDATLTVFGPPSITQQSTDQIIRAGTDVFLSAQADGTPPLLYQWNFNGLDIPGATNPTLFLTDFQSAAAGSYYVKVSNAYGFAQTLPALLTVTNSAPYILRQPDQLYGQFPRNPLAGVGGSTTFSVMARGSTPLSYQWRFAGVDLPGATNATLSLTNLRYDQTGYYNVEISNAFGTTNSVKVFLNVVQVYVWGESATSPAFGAPTNVPSGLTNVVAVAAGNFHLLALKADGRVATWSASRSSESTLTNVPASVTNVIAIAAASDNSMALRANGSVVVWGNNSYGQNNVPTSVSNGMAIAVGGGHCLVLRTTGTIVGWGNNSYGQAAPPVGLSNVVAIAAGGAHSLALKTDGTVVGWGYNAFGQINPPVGLSNVIAIDAAGAISLALKADGTAIAWGDQGGKVPTNVTNLVATGVGYLRSLGLNADGKVVSWASSQTPISPTLSNVIAITSGERGIFSAAVIGNGAPFFTLHPATQSTVKSNTVKLHARAAGVQPMHYQWQLDGANLTGATNPDLTISNAQGSDIGGYRCVAVNSLGTSASTVARLTIPYSGALAVALNATNLTWATNIQGQSFGPSWFAQIRETHDGDAAAQSGPIAHNQQSLLQTFVNGPGTLTFWWKVSSEEGFDFLKFVLGRTTTLLASISGETVWQQQTVHLASGGHSLQWIYAKDGNVSAGRDAGWLDEVVFTPDPPVITRQPQPNLTVPAGASASYKLEVSGLGPISFQWFKDGNSMLGATQTFLNLPSVNRRSSGTYRAQASNAGGSVMSSNAVLKVIVQQRLGSMHMISTGSLEITSQDADGGALSSLDLPAFEAQVSTNLVHWQTLPDSLITTNGSLLLRDPAAPLWPRRFYRIVEH